MSPLVTHRWACKELAPDPKYASALKICRATVPAQYRKTQRQTRLASSRAWYGHIRIWTSGAVNHCARAAFGSTAIHQQRQHRPCGPDTIGRPRPGGPVRVTAEGSGGDSNAAKRGKKRDPRPQNGSRTKERQHPIVKGRRIRAKNSPRRTNGQAPLARAICV